MATKLAHNNYQQKIEKEKESLNQEKDDQKLENKRLEELAVQEKNKTIPLIEKKTLFEKEMELQTKLITVGKLLKDGNRKLTKAVENSDETGAGVARMIIATATSKIEYRKGYGQNT